MKITKYALALAMGLGSLFASTPLLADQVNVTITDLTVNGLNACPPAPVCSESLTASFQWDNSTNTYVNGTATGSASGALGSMSVFETPTNYGGGRIEVAFANGSNDTIILEMGETGGMLTVGTYPLMSNTLEPPAGSAAGFLICGLGPVPTTDTCSTTDYPFPIFFRNGFPAEGAFAASGMVSVSGVPEPSSLLLIGTGLAGLGVISRKRLA